MFPLSRSMHLCILTLVLSYIQDNEEKQFIYRHSRTVFELLDEDRSHSISAEEFSAFGFLFNFHGAAVNQIFNDFDISGDEVVWFPSISPIKMRHDRLFKERCKTVTIIISWNYSHLKLLSFYRYIAFVFVAIDLRGLATGSE